MDSLSTKWRFSHEPYQQPIKAALAIWLSPAEIAAGYIGIAMLASDGGLVAARKRRDHLEPATR
jgi:hypothetical protein